MKAVTLEVGSVYGRLTVIGNTIVGRYSAAICQCECGVIKNIRRYSITHGVKGKKTLSCGCLAKEVARVTLRADRGSSFDSPEAYIAHRKVWLKEYAKSYDARPEQRLLRAQQEKARWERMTPDQREREKEISRLNAARPANKERAKKYNLTYVARPEIAKKLQTQRKRHHEIQRDNLSDAYVSNCFTQGSQLKMADLPKEIIEAVRVRIQIKRKLKEFGK